MPANQVSVSWLASTPVRAAATSRTKITILDKSSRRFRAMAAASQREYASQASASAGSLFPSPETLAATGALAVVGSNADMTVSDQTKCHPSKQIFWEPLGVIQPQCQYLSSGPRYQVL